MLYNFIVAHLNTLAEKWARIILYIGVDISVFVYLIKSAINVNNKDNKKSKKVRKEIVYNNSYTRNS